MPAQISVRVDNKVKLGAEKVLDDIGLSMSSAINIFLKAVQREQRIPFELSADPFSTEKNISYLENIAKDVDSGKSKFIELDPEKLK